MIGDERLELGDELVVPAQGQVGVDPQLEGCEPDLLEPSDGCLREAFVREVHERRASPERQRFPEPLRRVGRQPAPEQAPSLVHQVLEAMEIEGVRLDPEDVARRPRRQHVGEKRLAEARDVDAQRAGGDRGRVLAPELVDQLVAGHDLVGVQEEHGQERARLGAAERYLAAFVPRLERSQDPELHRASGRGR